MNRHQNSITDPTIKSLFENKNFAFVATSMKDGSPHVTPTWVDIEDNYILINTAIGRVKQKNVARDPRVSVSITDMNNPYHMVTVNGEIVEQIKGEEAEKHIDKLAKKYLNKDKYPGRAPGEERILLKIKPKKVVHMK
jgi:PPOX class probable F420-dependent enzyme